MAGGLDRIRGVYAIVDPEVCGKRDPMMVLEAVLASGVAVVQLRAKDMPAGQMTTLAKKMSALCGQRDALFIVNDRLDVALVSGARGVHLGQDDLPLRAARKVAGPDFIVGLSTHTLEEARAAEAGCADYIGFGAIYSTLTKSGVTDPQGPERLAEIAKAVSLPVVAIGGIGPDNIGEVGKSGARAAAVISALCAANDPGRASRELMENWSRK